MRGYIANTHSDWFDFLARKGRWDEVILLRSDLHRLFDRGYVTVTTEYTLEVSEKLKGHFQNGKSYYPLHGVAIAVPKSIGHRPDPTFLRWHNEHKFLF